MRMRMEVRNPLVGFCMTMLEAVFTLLFIRFIYPGGSA
jgi:hypothetical protein